MTIDDIAAARRAGSREWAGLAALVLPALLVAMDTSVLNVAVPVLSRQLRPSSAELLWIVDIYGFMVAGFLIMMGTLGDRIGRRRLLMYGATGFGAASVLAAYSANPAMLIGARAALGIAGATLAPCRPARRSGARSPGRRRCGTRAGSGGARRRSCAGQPQTPRCRSGPSPESHVAQDHDGRGMSRALRAGEFARPGR